MAFHSATRAESELGGERGAIIILALAFLSVMGLITFALITFADVGSKSLTSYRIERTRRYAADSALQATVRRLADNPNFAVSASFSDCARLPLFEYTSGGNIPSVVASGTRYVTVQCRNTPNGLPPGVDLDGGQAPRDIELQVVCSHSASMVVDRKLTCGSGANSTIIGRARVRFENNYDLAAYPNINQRAVVPKILVWSIWAVG